MERDCKREKPKKGNSENGSPLQILNQLQIHKLITKTCSNLSSSAASNEDPKTCSRFSLSSNSSSSSSFSAYSRINLGKRSRTLSRSKENQIPQKSKKNQPRHQTGKEINAKPICKSGPRSKISSSQGDPENKSKKGPQKFRVKAKNLRENGSGKRTFELLGVSNISELNSSDNCAPLGIVANSRTSHSIYERDNCRNGNAVKTPPIEASLSPEIQLRSNSRMLVLESEVTPVCYGDGHLLSGVTDKRKCRRRGSLRGGSEKVNLFGCEGGDGGVSDVKESSIPSLAEASVRWHLSPCDEGREDLGIDSRHKLDQCRMICDDDDLGGHNLLSSNEKLCGNEFNLLCDDNRYRGRDGAVNKRPLNYNVVECLLAPSPNAAYGSNDISSGEERHFNENLAMDNSRSSIGSLSSGNVIQTPDSESNSLDSKFDRHELDSITKALERVNLSPVNGMPMWDPPGLGIRFPDKFSPLDSIDPTKLGKNVDSVSSSWVSDATIDNVSLSRMRISWRDGLGRTTVETDEFDCCCLLADEEVNVDESVREVLKGDKSCQRTSPRVEIEPGQNKERMGNDLSPVVLDYEPSFSNRRKEKSSSFRADACAESIYTDGGDLVASDDSDWDYLHENRLFQIK